MLLSRQWGISPMGARSPRADLLLQEMGPKQATEYTDTIILGKYNRG